MFIKQCAKSVIKKLWRQAFVLLQRFGLDVLPRHFYSEIPDITLLRQTRNWRKPYSMLGIAGCSVEEQLAFVSSCCSSLVRARMLSSPRLHTYGCERNGEVGYGPVESDFLYAFTHTVRPKQILQIGCGVSTAICLLAAEDAGYCVDLTCIEPYPSPFLVRAEREGRIRLLRQRAQDVDIDCIRQLSGEAFFFVDSTHTLGPAGEVSRIILEMLPLLKPGAHAHFHDIYFPYDYEPGILDYGLFFWHESILLQSFLTCNSRFAISASLSMLHHAAPKELSEHLPNYRPALHEQGVAIKMGHFPSSTFLKVLA